MWNPNNAITSELFSTISNDDIYNISSFLTPIDIVQIELTCKSAKYMIEPYWTVYANINLIDYYTLNIDDDDVNNDGNCYQNVFKYERIINKMNKKFIKLDFSFQNARSAKMFVLQIFAFEQRIYRNPIQLKAQSITLQYEQQRRKERILKEQFQQQKQLKQNLIKNLFIDFKVKSYASSLDRIEESAKNVLQPSKCFLAHNSTSVSNHFLSSTSSSPEIYGIFCQLQCGCAHGKPLLCFSIPYYHIHSLLSLLQIFFCSVYYLRLLCVLNVYF